MINRLYGNCLKRFFDFSVAFFGLLILLPFCVILLPLVSLSNGGPVFFTQTRPGKNGKLFRLTKLKTMNDNRDYAGKLLPDSVRLTSFGRFVRSLSLDEVPQLLNVFMGDMSLVGPRPLLTDYLPLYNKQQARRHEVRPGITGWAQVNGRNALSWEERFNLDVWYVDHVSLALDLKILFMTLLKVLKREGISSGTAATMERFRGSKE